MTHSTRDGSTRKQWDKLFVFFFGGAIVGSEKTIEIYSADAAVTKPEVSGLHAGKHGSWHIGGSN